MKIMKRCMDYMEWIKTDSTLRDYKIGLGIEDHINDEFKEFQQVLLENDPFPAYLQKKLLNYKRSNELQDEQTCREIVFAYKTGQYDPTKLNEMNAGGHKQQILNSKPKRRG